MKLTLKHLIAGLALAGAASLSFAADEDAQAALEKQCRDKGWVLKTLKVGERERRLMVRAPKGPWTGGAIIVMHGGGGSYLHFGAGPRLTRPQVSFCDQAQKRGFAVLALDSTDGAARDAKGRSYGKRWDCVAIEGRDNIDLPFIREVITKLIPELRPQDSAEHVFLTGVSNGGYMTTLAATQLADRVTAFAPMSCGDPYGTHIDAGVKVRFERKQAPGVFVDNETGKRITEAGAATAASYPNEKPWPKLTKKPGPRFKQFQHAQDGIVDLSNMKKAQKQLEAHGFQDAGPMILEAAGRKRLVYHFWLEAYNKPMLDFFSGIAEKKSEEKTEARGL